MFDVGFWELVLIFGMGLMILGPERMPRVAAQVGRWIGRAQRTANQFRRKLQRELELDDLVREGIMPRKPPTRPATTTKSGNTPTTVPANAKAAGADSDKGSTAGATKAASMQAEASKTANAQTGASKTANAQTGASKAASAQAGTPKVGDGPEAGPS